MGGKLEQVEHLSVCWALEGMADIKINIGGGCSKLG